MTSARTFGVRCRGGEGTLHVDITGELDLAAEPAVVEALSDHLTTHEVSRVVIDVTAVTFIDSSGLRALLRCRDLASRAGAAPALILGGNDGVHRLLEIAGVTNWFVYA
jgi:anti-sigma B factor antagonist/stage II sporulation protein AA (anti-sigma F factor antagonist)